MTGVDQRLIRNFCIIAHIDHGKSTLADRILQLTGAVSERDMRSQVLDSMDLERERGITIKAQAVRVHYTASDGQTYQLNLIDTPGHVDFSYEVSRSLAACEGALLVVDASQGIEAQTLANTYLAIEGDLEIDPGAQQDRPARGRPRAARPGRGRPDRRGPRTGCCASRPRPARACARCSRPIVERVPPPRATRTRRPRALIFDSVYDQYRGVVAFVRVVDGAFREGDRLRAMQTGLVRGGRGDRRDDPGHDAAPGALGAGETGYLVTGLKNLGDLRVGDTLTRAPSARRRGRCPGTARSSRWSSAASSRSTPTTTRTCATRSRSSRSTTPRCAGSPRPRRRSASASAAGSSACCTWTSCASAWSASTTSSCWPRRPTSSTG